MVSTVYHRGKCYCCWSDGGSLAAIGGRDNSLFLFRALGKILYCKRETSTDGEREGEGEGEREGVRGEEVATRGAAVALPPHLQHHQRPHLLVDPEVCTVTETLSH